MIVPTRPRYIRTISVSWPLGGRLAVMPVDRPTVAKAETTSKMTWSACEVLNEASGKPVVHLSGALAEWFDARRLQAHVTVTDEGDYAASFVVVETKEPL